LRRKPTVILAQPVVVACRVRSAMMNEDLPPAGMRIVLATFGSLGDLQPFLAIGVELQTRGHAVTVATSEFYRGHVLAAGLAFAPVRPDRAAGQQDPDFFARVARQRQAPSAVFREMFLPSLRESLDDLLRVTASADVVVAHPLASGARLAAELARAPWISAVMQPMGYLSSYEPPIIGPRWISAALRTLGPGLTRRALRGGRALTDSWAAEWRALRHDVGLPPDATHPLWEGQHSPRLSLGLFPRILGTPQPDWPASARVTGFPFYAAPDRTLDPTLETFLGAGEPPLVFSLGTTAVNDPGTFFEESAAAARALDQRAVLLAGALSVCGFTKVAPGVVAVPYAPHELLFPRALAIVHQGGIGTLSEGLRAGRPMLIMPYGHDQADNAWRAARLGVARVIPRRSYRDRNPRFAIARLLADPRHASAAARVANEVARERGATTAANLIENAMR
jgi:rhamnosyltransferase subunit B